MRAIIIISSPVPAHYLIHSGCRWASCELGLQEDLEGGVKGLDVVVTHCDTLWLIVPLDLGSKIEAKKGHENEGLFFEASKLLSQNIH